MNAALTIMSAVDWSKFDLEGWLYQFGAWMNSVSGTCSKSVNPIAVAMDQAVVKQKKLKLTDMQKQQITAGYFSEDSSPKLNRTRLTCEIDDNEARAVQRIILDMQGQSVVLDEWMDAVISRYFYGCSWSQMVKWEQAVDEEGNLIFNGLQPKMIKVYSENDARLDVKCGLAALHSRYGFIQYL